MIYGSWWVNTICFLAICGAVVLSPLYGLWVGCGMLADRADRRRVSMLKGPCRTEAKLFNN
jgi:hypothetical protein